MGEGSSHINESLYFCETPSKRSVEVYRVKIYTPTDVTDILTTMRHGRDRHNKGPLSTVIDTLTTPL